MNRRLIFVVIEIDKDLLEEVTKFSWKIFSDKNSSSFPKYKNYEEMYRRFFKSVLHPDDKLLAYYEDTELIGSLSLLVDKKTNYLQAIGGIFAKRDFNKVCDRFMKYLKTNYSGYKIHFGYPLENERGISFLEGIKAKPVDASITMNLEKDDFIKKGSFDEVIPLEEKHYKEYAAFHDNHNPNMWWNSERIFEKIDLWKIYVIIKKDKIVGSIFIKLLKDDEAEVFGISIDEEYINNNLELKLLSEATYSIFEQGRKELLYFVDEFDKVGLEATLNVGFKQIDTYRSYEVNL
jgi:hypothetical protein